jgi:hypothetical protein
MKHAFLAAILLLSTPAKAQERMTPAQCTGSWAALEALMGAPVGDAGVVADDEGWCLILDGTFDINADTSFRLASLRWRASDIDRFIEDGLPPRTIEIVGKGIGVVAQFGDPVFDYLFGLQNAQPRAGFGLTVRWDGVQNAVLVDTAYVDLFAGNRIEATARLDGVNLTDRTTMQMSVGAMGLRDLSITSEFAGWFEAYIAMPLGTMLLDSDAGAPDAQVEALKGQAIEAVGQIPDAIMPQTARDALSAFVTSLPHPRGKAQLQISADPSLGAARLAQFAMLPDQPSTEKIVEPALNGVSVLFTWSPAVEEP